MIHVSKMTIDRIRPHVLIHRTERNADGTPVRMKINGKMKTWKTRPGCWMLPVKYGIRDCYYIGDWDWDSPIPQQYKNYLSPSDYAIPENGEEYEKFTMQKP